MFRLFSIFSVFMSLPVYCTAQYDWGKLLENTENQWLVTEIDKSFNLPQNPCPPDLAKLIEPSEIDSVLHPFAQDKNLESESIESLFKNNCSGLRTLRLLSDLYFPLFSRQLDANGLDKDYRFLPVVISGLNSEFDNNARAGLWGIDILTARSNGMRIDRQIDERKAADPSTQLAVKMIKKFEKEFQGDRIKVIVAMLRGQRFASSFSFAKADVELRRQLCLLHVLIRMFNHTESKPSLMLWLQMLQNYEAIPLRKTMSYNALETVLDIPEGLLRHLNPAFHGDTIPANFRKVSFLIPANKIEQFALLEDSIANFIVPIKETPAQPEPQTFAYHTVKSGDVLGLIAQKYGVSVAQIRRLNNLKSDNIRIGQRLKISADSTDVVSKPKPSTSNNSTQVYTVRSGDSLWLIAKKFPGVSIEDIQRENGIGDGIQPGQKLTIPAAK
ncbi:MAG: LysM peptidoglycan-binding domain-containing protein [Cryomorphaceae bacterium]|nr:LysM peptidoglycan-binding domain-containing protein [Cryomorphaceae bacterium]